ncbi:hypothetical protein N9047_01285 [bacterium]|nr:hypothetical protein [bacterium]
MIAYLCELHNLGTKDPLKTFLTHLKVDRTGADKLPDQLSCQFEWKKVDLAVFDKEADPTKSMPLIMVEMKVDSGEHYRTTRTKDACTANGKQHVPQTDAYADCAETCRDMLFVTLGIGEYSKRLKTNNPNNRFRTVTLEEFEQALNSISFPDKNIWDWKSALKHELDRRKLVINNLDSDIEVKEMEFRKGQWNSILLNELKKRVAKVCPKEFDPNDFSVYTYGARPDTILNFGSPFQNDANADLASIYLEINYTGKLSLKSDLGDFSVKNGSDKESRVEKLRELFKKRADINRKAPNRKPGKTATVYQYDISLSRSKNKQKKLLAPNIEDTANSVGKVMYAIIKASKLDS